MTDALLQDQIRYLELRLAECRARPLLHGCQIAAYEQQLALARGAGTALDYLAAMEGTGTTLEIVRAEWLDRYRNWGCAYAALGNDEKYRAAAMNYAAAEAATGRELISAMIAVKTRSGALHQAAEASAGVLPSVLVALMDWAVETRSEAKSELGAAVAALWDELRANDPGCTWQRIATHPRYRRRIPFDDARIELLGGWLAEIVPESATGAPGPGYGQGDATAPEQNGADDVPAGAAGGGSAGEVGQMAIPTAAQAALAYHYAYDALDRSDPALQGARALYEHIFVLEEAAGSGPTFLRRMAEDNVYCRLARDPQIDRARAALARCRGEAQPHMEHHYQTLIAALSECRSPTEVEYEIELLGEYFAVEAAWCEIALRFATRALLAVALYQGDRSEAQRQSVALSARMVRTFFGKDWDGMLAVPWIRDFFCQVLFTRGQALTTPGNAPATLGTVGGPLVNAVREAVVGYYVENIEAMQQNNPEEVSQYIARHQSEPLFATPEALRDYLTGLFREAMDGKDASPPAPEPTPQLVLWGRPVDLDELLAVLAEPPRPVVDLTM